MFGVGYRLTVGDETMNRLWVRLTLAFALVVLVAVGAIALLINRTTGVEFRRYVTDSGMQVAGSGMQQLVEYYQHHGSWEGVDSLLSGGVFVNGSMGMDMPRLVNDGWRPGMQPVRWTSCWPTPKARSSTTAPTKRWASRLSCRGKGQGGGHYAR